MTQDEIKKGLEYAAKVTGNDVFAGAYKIITEQEKEIERLKEEKKQAQIDVLDELKRKYGFYTCCSWHRETKLLAEIIDKFIEEIQNEN